MCRIWRRACVGYGGGELTLSCACACAQNLVEEYRAAGMQSKTVAPSSVPLRTVTTGDMNISTDKMVEDIQDKLKQKICQHKDDLWWYWMQIDTQSTGLVPAAIWRQGMASALQLELPWFNIQKTMVKVDEDGMINYKEFLDGVTLDLEVP